MLQVRLFQNPVLAITITTRLLAFMAGTAGQLLLPIYIISYRGQSSGTAGLIMFLFAVGLGIAGQTCGRLGDRFGERRFVVIGFTGTLVTAILLSRIHESTPLAIIALVMFLNGMAMGTWSVPNNSILMGTVPRSMLGVAGALSNLTRNVAQTLGQATASAVVAAAMVSQGFDVALDELRTTPGAGDAFLAGVERAFLVVTVLAAAAVVITVVTRPRFAVPEVQLEEV